MSVLSCSALFDQGESWTPPVTTGTSIVAIWTCIMPGAEVMLETCTRDARPSAAAGMW